MLLLFKEDPVPRIFIMKDNTKVLEILPLYDEIKINLRTYFKDTFKKEKDASYDYIIHYRHYTDTGSSLIIRMPKSVIPSHSILPGIPFVISSHRGYSLMVGYSTKLYEDENYSEMKVIENI